MTESTQYKEKIAIIKHFYDPISGGDLIIVPYSSFNLVRANFFKLWTDNIDTK